MVGCSVEYGPGRSAAGVVLGNVSASEYVGTTCVEVILVLEKVEVACGDGNAPSREGSKLEPEPKSSIPAATPPIISSTTAVRTRDTPLSILAAEVSLAVCTHAHNE